VTEALWGHLRQALSQNPVLASLAADWPAALIVAPWPVAQTVEGWEDGKVADFGLVQEVVRSIRNLRAEKKVGPAKRIPARLVAGDRAELFRQQAATIALLAGLDASQISILETVKVKPADSVALVAGPVEIYIPLSGMVDLEEERKRIRKELADARAQIDRLEKLLGSDFASKAPAAVVQRERERLVEFQEMAGKLKAQIG
jgi:valyl-tRNA synthetase